MKRLFDISLFILIFYVFNGPSFISNFVEANYDIRIFANYPYFFFLLPVLVILGHTTMMHKLHLPYFILFCAVLAFFILLESSYFRGEDIIVRTYFIYQWLIIYTVFLVLINYGISEWCRNKLIIFSLIVICFLDLFQYLSILGIFESLKSVQDIKISHSRITTGFVQEDGFSWSNGFGIIILLFSKQEKIFRLKQLYWWLLIILFFLMIVLNASRGAFLTTLACITVVLLFSKPDITNRNKILYLKIIAIIVVLLSSNYIFDFIIHRLFIIKRIAFETTADDSRIKQIIISLNNFIQNPFFGTGFNLATRHYRFGIFRSNFSYTQILASHGIFYFIIYMIFLVKFIGIHYRGISFLLLLVFGYVSLMFEQPCNLFFISIIAYLNYYYNDKTKKQAIIIQH